MTGKVYYVYAYLRISNSQVSSVGTPYYIGKGKGKRAFDGQHVVSVPREKERIVIIKNYLSEAEAFELEKLLISYYGRVDNHTGILRNLTNGGEGGSGRVITEEYRKKFIGENNHFFGKSHPSEIKRLLSSLKIGKTYEEIMGDEVAAKVKQIKAERMIGNVPKNKGKTLEELHGVEKGREIRQKIVNALKGENNPMYGVRPSAEQIEKKRKEKLMAEKIECPYCQKVVDHMNYGRWHGDNCKMKGDK